MDSAAIRRSLELDYVADLACPWCYVGIERLARAREQRPAVDLRLRWRPFMLNPDLPASGIERADYLRAKFGPNAGRIYDRIAAVGRREGIPFAFERIQRQPNTTDAHRLILHAQAAGRGEAVIGRLFRAFYSEGADIGDRAVLVALAGEVGLDEAASRRLLQSERYESDVLRSQRTTTWQGIRGVPVFILAQAHALSGAQPAEVLVQLIDFALTPAAAPA